MNDLKAIAFSTVPVVVGVILAGYIMANWPHLPVVADARNGFDN